MKFTDAERLAKLLKKFNRPDLWWMAKKLDADNYAEDPYGNLSKSSIAQFIIERIRNYRPYKLASLDFALQQGYRRKFFVQAIYEGKECTSK